jgi:hypothetical protein
MRQIKPLPPIDLLASWFEIKGSDLVWKQSSIAKLIGKRAGHRRPDGYIELYKGGHKMLAHRVVYALANNVDPGNHFVDHIDGNPSNNSPSNLRTATSSQNLQNCRRLSRHNKSGKRGVRFVIIGGIEYWKAEFHVDGKLYSIGAYATKEAAIAAREVAEKFAYGKFSPLATLPAQELFPLATGA